MKNLGAVILLFLANTISGIAQGISMIAIPWYFTQQGESNVFGYVYLGITFTALFWSPTAGTFVDRFSRKAIFMVLTIVSGCIVSSVAYAGHQMEHIPMALAGLVFAITFFNYNLHYPTLYAFLQEITEPK
ncbi:MAG: MFS transporter permease, partial [Bacteroidota bacterium]